MEHRLLGRSGLKVPVLSFGTGTFGGGNEFFRTWGEIDVVVCPDVGVDLFETADIYSNGLSEEILDLNRLLQRPIVSTIVMGARNEEQLKQNLGAAGWNLASAQVAKLDAASDTNLIYPYCQRQFEHNSPVPESRGR